MQGASYGCNIYTSFIRPFSPAPVLAKLIKENDNGDADDDDNDEDAGPNADDKARKGCN